MQLKIAIIGAGASGLFCAGLLAQQGHQVTIIDNGKKPGRKILMSGGGNCNFTNLNIDAQNYISQNPHFCKSALKRFTQWDFIELVNAHKIAYHEKELGQLFCDNSAQDIVNLLVQTCQQNSVTFKMQTELLDIEIAESYFELKTNKETIHADRVVVATGGLSMPKLGTTPFGYKIAEKFGLSVIPIKAGLVPFTLSQEQLVRFSTLSGISLLTEVTTKRSHFKGNLLFTHRGLSGPVILQSSSYWQVGEPIIINLLPQIELADFFKSQLELSKNQTLKTVLSKLLPKRLVECLIEFKMIPDILLKQLNSKKQSELIHQLTHFEITPNGTEGYRTAEVTLGGIDTNELSSKTFESKKVANLYFIGEVIDVTGWLGGYNFQWAWSSAFACASEMK